MRYLIKLDRKGIPVPGSLVYNTSYPQKGRWMEVETLDKDEEGHCIQPPKPYNYYQKIKYYYLVDDCCNPIAGSNVNAYCKPTGNYFEFFPACLLKQCIPPPLEINVIINGEILCYGGSTTYTVTASGGYPPYTGVGTFTATAGTYEAIVTDSHDQTISASVVIPAATASQLLLNLHYHNIDCYGDNNGYITASASGGTAPYQYAITAINSVPVTNPVYQSSGLFDNLGPAEYQITVVDDNECIRILSAEINEPPLLEVSLVSTNALCYGEPTGTITTTVTGGVPPYSYAWSGGSLVSSSQNQNALFANTYTVLVTDHNGCQVSAQATITEPAEMILSIDVFDILCYGDADGSIDLSVTGGVPPYTYAWSNGATTEDLTGLGPGRYRVVVTDDNGCTKELDTVVREPLELVASESHVPPLCFGDMTGSITLLVGGGTAPYTYAWTGPGVNPTSQNQTGLASGTYGVTITDAHNCQVSISNIILDVTEITATLNYVVTDPLTGESTVTVNSVSGGNPPYQYSLDGGPYQTSNVFTNVFPTPGGHDVTIKDLNDCIKTLLIDIPPPCLCYRVESATTNVITIAWLDCNGVFNSVTSVALPSPWIGCAQEGSVNVTALDPYTLTGGTSACTTNLDCAPCYCYHISSPLFQAITYSYVNCEGDEVGPITTPLIDGQTPSAYVCAKEETITATYTTPCGLCTAISVVKGDTCVMGQDCSIPASCTCYELDATNGGKLGIEYTDCDGNQLIVNGGDRIAACVKEITNIGPGCTATLIIDGCCDGGKICECILPTITCHCYEIIPEIGGCTVDYTLCDGTKEATTVTVDTGSLYVCARLGSVFVTPNNPGDNALINDSGKDCISNEECQPQDCQCYELIAGTTDLEYTPCGQTKSDVVLAGTTSYKCVAGIVDLGDGGIANPSGASCTTNGDCSIAWRGLTLVCEPETQFNILKVITGLSSPFTTWYDESLNRVWVADGDNFIKGNVYWFNPATAMTEADMTYYPGIKANALYANYIDAEKRKIYLWGTDTDNLDQNQGSGIITGLVVYDMDTNTHYQVSYGSNIAYRRMINFVSGDYLYGNDDDNGEIVIFDRTADPITIINSINFYATGAPSYFTNGTGWWTTVGNMIWIVGGSGSYSSGNVGIFTQDFIYQGEIVLPGRAVVPGYNGGNNAYWQSGFYDDQYNKFYVNDIGSNNLYIISVNGTYDGGTVIETRSLTYMTENRNYVAGNLSVDPVSNKLYVSFQQFDQIGVSPITNKSYEIDRATTEFVRFFSGIGIPNLKIVNDGTYTNSLMGAAGGNVMWGTGYPSPSYTDGTVTIYNNTTPGDNSGIVDVLTEEQYYIIDGTPTGSVKQNLPYINEVINPDYIAPYLDETTCPITYTTTCPTITSKPFATGCYYEFNIINTVKLNPAIAYIKVNLLNAGNSVITSTTITAPFTTNYYSGSLTSVTGTYHIEVEYYDIDDVLIPCT